jgi:hypothetical protein
MWVRLRQAVLLMSASARLPRGRGGPRLALSVSTENEEPKLGLNLEVVHADECRGVCVDLF